MVQRKALPTSPGTRSPIFRPNSACTFRSRSIRAASGILAGDHCKEASDLGLPLVGVGFVYPQGYFHQRISPEGRQEAIYERFDYNEAPMEPVITQERRWAARAEPQRARVIYIEVWRVQLGVDIALT